MLSFSSLPSFLLERTMVVYISTVHRDSSIVDTHNTVCRCEFSTKVLTVVFVRFCHGPRMRYKKSRRVYTPLFPFNPCCLHVDVRPHHDFLVQCGICFFFEKKNNPPKTILLLYYFFCLPRKHWVDKYWCFFRKNKHLTRINFTRNL
jgi:hypothetical protein